MNMTSSSSTASDRLSPAFTDITKILQWLRPKGWSRSIPEPAAAPTQPGRPPARMRAEDREFLPAALEIVETPPSPVAITFIWSICLVFLCALLWSYFGWLDIHAIAPGKIQPNGKAKVIQPLESGRVAALLVENGSRVEAGQVLIELDPTETAADREMQARDIESADAEWARRKAAVEGAGLDRPAAVPIAFPTTIRPHIRERETSLLAAELAQLDASLQTLGAQLVQQQATVRRLTDDISGRERLIALGKERVDMRELLDKKGASSRALIIEALEKYETELATQLSESGQLREARAAVQATERKIVEARAQFIADQMQKLVEAHRKSERASQELIKAISKNERTRLRSPIAGVVQQLSVTTIGQVVSGGQSLLTIVPPDAPLEIEALILNKDIGFVHVGQEAVVKIEAFPFTRYGTIQGTVTRVSVDAVDMRNAPNLSEASAMTRSPGMTPTSSTNAPELAFPATIALARDTIDVGGTMISLLPGMSVTVEIQTGKRRIIDYLLAPLREVVLQTAHER
ncbi:MAG: HlyD family type I secretion periplasmic adaptor subunit [Proteobacteria bacterium]|nr:MAG: HlyD family type I secretion periplasmic adaptor subunit [Pseudomonadota bacterium]